jgi:hypothetical protein
MLGSAESILYSFIGPLTQKCAILLRLLRFLHGGTFPYDQTKYVKTSVVDPDSLNHAPGCCLIRILSESRTRF